MKAADHALAQMTTLRDSLRAAVEAAKRKRKAMEEMAKRAGERPRSPGDQPAIVNDPWLLFRIQNGGVSPGLAGGAGSSTPQPWGQGNGNTPWGWAPPPPGSGGS